MMHVAAPAAMKRLAKAWHPPASERAALEQAKRGYHHGKLRTEMARRWRFPSEIVEPLSQSPLLPSNSVIDPLAAFVHIATWRARIDALRFSLREVSATWPSQPVNSLSVPLVWLPDAATIGGATRA